MIIPIRCFTCGKVIGHMFEEFKNRTENGEDPGKILDELGLKRYCCRRMLISHVNLIGQIKKYV